MIEEWIAALLSGMAGFLYAYFSLRNGANIARITVTWIIGCIIAFATLTAVVVAFMQLYSSAAPIAVAIAIMPPKWAIFLGPSFGLAIAGLVRYQRTKRGID